MSLSRFMPYGAPDLLADQEQRMARATLAACASVVALFALLVVLRPLLPRTIEVPNLGPPHWLEPPPSPPDLAPRIALPTSSPRVAPPHAVPVPVPDAAPSAPIAPSEAPGAVSSQTTPGVEDAARPIEPAVPDDDPQPGAFQYVDEMPELISCAPVAYPDLARDAGVEGRVVVLVLVGRDGHVRETRIAPGTSVPMLDAAALAAAASCVFKPAIANGHPVAVWVSRPYVFHLHGD